MFQNAQWYDEHSVCKINTVIHLMYDLHLTTEQDVVFLMLTHIYSQIILHKFCLMCLLLPQDKQQRTFGYQLKNKGANVSRNGLNLIRNIICERGLQFEIGKCEEWLENYIQACVWFFRIRRVGEFGCASTVFIVKREIWEKDNLCITCFH